MNHRSLFSGLDIPRKYLLEAYRYNNWNNAAVKGACLLDGDSLLVYGNIGVWLTDTGFTFFSDYNAGFPDGIDNRKINRICQTSDGRLLAATLFGLYIFDPGADEWVHHAIPDHDEQVVDIAEASGSTYIMTRSHLYRMDKGRNGYEFHQIALPPPAGYRDETGLFKTLWVIHSGEIGGVAGKLFVDLLALSLAFLSLSGIVYWLFPKWMKRRKHLKREIGYIIRINRFSLKWHNKVGVWVVVFLLVTTITGMFLRPPLLIAIANARVGKIPYTVLDDPNPWYDQLRRIIYEERYGAFIVGTNKGIYFADQGFKQELLPFDRQPPLSVMGINVFEKTDEGHYLVGSFNGLFLWNPYQGWMIDYFSPGSAVVVNPSGPPLSENMTAGAINVGESNRYIFDYNRGVIRRAGSIPFPAMPDEIIEKSPMSLWNLALEFHTARYYSFFFGKLYILFIPLFGLTMIVILLTGLWLWWKRFRKKSA